MKYLLIILLFGCAKEYSCEDCREPKIDTIQQPPPPKDTIYNDLITSCNIYIQDESKVQAIYLAVKTKLHPGHDSLVEKITMDGSKRYIRTYRLEKHYDMNQFFKGDAFYIFYQIRYRFNPPEEVQRDTLIY